MTGGRFAPRRRVRSPERMPVRIAPTKDAKSEAWRWNRPSCDTDACGALIESSRRAVLMRVVVTDRPTISSSKLATRMHSYIIMGVRAAAKARSPAARRHLRSRPHPGRRHLPLEHPGSDEARRPHRARAMTEGRLVPDEIVDEIIRRQPRRA